MEPQQVVAYLKQIPLFSALTDEQGEEDLYRIARIVNQARFDDGEWLFGQGENSYRLYYIIEGEVRLTRFDPNGVKYEVGMRGPGSVFGETGLLVGDFHDVTAEAVTKTRVLYLERDDFLEIYNVRQSLRRKLKIRPEVARRLRLPKFDWLRNDEWVVFVVQRHWAQLVRKVAPPLLLFSLLMAVFLTLITYSSLTAKIISVILAIPLIVLIALAGWHYFNWRDDFFVLTTERVVHIERVWPFREHFEESFLENVEDIYEVRSGLAANVLNYGNLILQTAGETVEIDMDFVGNPVYLSQLVSREIERARTRDTLRAHGAIREVLEKRLNTGRTPDAEPIPVPETPSRPSVFMIFWGWLRDYFFPPSWSVSPDGDTIMWRRFWVPGFFRYLQIFIPLALLTIGGGYFLLSNWEQPNIIWFFAAWLFVETVLFAALLWFIEDWRNDYFQLTPNRLILVQRKPLLLQESRREAPLNRIQNISFEIPGIIGQLFHYGHVTLETAGTLGKFELRHLRHPQRVQAELSKRQREYVQREKEAEVNRRREELLSWFAMYDTLRQDRAASPPTQTGEAAAN